MESKEVIKSISKIYKQFNTPPNMQMHMYRAAAIAEMIYDNWHGPKINHDDIVAVNLVHDLGNIAKMGFSPERLKMLGPEAARVDYWKQIQADAVKKYDTSDDHLMTERMVAELNVSERFMYILTKKTFIMNKETLNSKDWEVKICSYSDQRVGPYGIMGLADRLNEWKALYTRDPTTKTVTPNTDMLIEDALEIEKQIAEKMSIKPEEINDKTAKPYIEKYQKQ